MRNLLLITACLAFLLSIVFVPAPATAQDTNACPANSYPGDFPIVITYGCSQAEAQRKAHAKLKASCDQTRADHGDPCEGSCDDDGNEVPDQTSEPQCVSFVSALSFTLTCSPADVNGCPEGSDPYVCHAYPPTAGGKLSCGCTCAE